MNKQQMYELFSSAFTIFHMIAHWNDICKNHITHVALKHNNMVIYAAMPMRHYHLYWFNEKYILLPTIADVEEGFMFRGEFVGRKMAKKIAIKQGQLQNETRQNDLFSEDLWDDVFELSCLEVNLFDEDDSVFKIDIIKHVIQSLRIDDLNNIKTLMEVIRLAIITTPDTENFKFDLAKTFISIINHPKNYNECMYIRVLADTLYKENRLK